MNEITQEIYQKPDKPIDHIPKDLGLIAKRISVVSEDLQKDVRQAAIAAYEAYPGKETPEIEGFKFLKWIYGATPLFEVNTEKFVAVFQSNKNTSDYLFAFKGSVTKWDWWEDFKFEFLSFPFINGPIEENFEVAIGFKDIYATDIIGTQSSLQWELFKSLNEYKPENLFIAAHSLGSALAEMFCYDLLKSKGFSKPSSLQHINFACPKVFNYEAAENFRSLLNNNFNVLRVVNINDLVPRLPEIGEEAISILYYRATDYFLIEFAALDDYPFLDDYAFHSMTNYDNVINRINMKLPISNPQEGQAHGVKLIIKDFEPVVVDAILTFKIPQ